MQVFTIEQKVTTNAGTEYVHIIDNEYCMDFYRPTGYARQTRIKW